ncbi:MAG: hypothetical protein P9E24_00855 [Candidatus Competibacter sp.]|nr:hypothetical protein [Candidatus Competibacter sp.]MDG4584835.1 hypothetical protein [Candidatus Competibacter sp.]
MAIHQAPGPIGIAAPTPNSVPSGSRTGSPPGSLGLADRAQPRAPRYSPKSATPKPAARQPAYTIPHLLMAAGVRHEPYTKAPSSKIVLTAANQLIGTYSDLRGFQQSSSQYSGWDAHHIVEAQDLERLGVQQRFPPYEQQICVLLPKTAHAKRINSVLRKENPSHLQATADELKAAYRDAYWLMGDYCGGGERRVREELVKIADTVFRWAGF